MIFEQAKEQLVQILGVTPSDEQWEAITAPLEPTLIVAGAGTGKTSVMTARVLWLVLTGQVPAEKILGLTFTNKAADELKHRVREKMTFAAGLVRGKNDSFELAEPTITTYNAFSSRLLKEHALRIGLEPDARIVVDALRYQLAFRAVARTSLDVISVGYDSRTVTADLVKFDEQMSNYFLDPQIVIAGESELIAKYENVEDPAADLVRMVQVSRKRRLLAQLLIEYREMKLAHDVIDYSDQVRLAAQAALESPAMRAALREEFQVVLLDEYQDTSIAQKILLQQLFGEGHSVMAVGDPCQGIYRWRGAEITNMDNFTTDFPNSDGSPARLLHLTINRRSVTKILNAANEISSELRNLHPIIDELVSAEPDAAAGSLVTTVQLTAHQEIEKLCDRVIEFGKTHSWGEIAVLTRINVTVAQIVSELEKRRVPIQVADPASLFGLPEVREVISYLQVLCDPAENVGLARILTGPRWQIGPRDMAAIGKFAQELSGFKEDDSQFALPVQLDRIVAGNDGSERISLLDAIEQIESIKAKISPAAYSRALKLADELRELRRHVHEPVIDLVARIIRVTGLGVEALIQRTTDGVTHFDRLSMFLDLAGSFRDLDGQSTLPAFVAYISDNDRYNVNIESELPGNTNAVTVMTIHKAKGLEYPVVLLPNWSKDAFPGSRSDDYWFSNAYLVPFRYLPSRLGHELTHFPGEPDLFKKSLEEHKAYVNKESRQDDLRLAYVAITRAAKHLVISGAWWGATQKKLRGPSEFLNAIRQHSESSEWAVAPDEDRNPFLEKTETIYWPRVIDPDITSRIKKNILSVQTANPIDINSLSGAEQKIIAEIQADISALQQQANVASADERLVRLPKSLTASQLMSLAADHDEFLRNLVRPMPRQPSRVADRGTAFHAWVEDFYGQRGLFDLDELPGAMDLEIYSDDELEKLKQAFKESIFATRAKPEMEIPFGIVHQGTTWRGRIDAVFTGTIADSKAPDRWLVVDWKTGRAGSADELQLHIYRHAWAQIKNVDIEKVQAAFYYVGDAQLVELTETLTLEQIASHFLS